MKHRIPIELYFCIFAFIYEATSAAKILGIFTSAAPSHFIFHQAMMQSLADRGHQITFFTQYPPTKVTDNIRYIDSRPTKIKGSAFDFKNLSWQKYIEVIVDEALEKECYDFMNVQEVQKLLNSPDEKYDIMFVEMILMYECYLPVAKILGIPVIGTLSMPPWPAIDEEFRNPHSSSYPFLVSSHPSHMSFYQRLQNVFDQVNFQFILDTTIAHKLQKFYNLHFPSYNLQTDKEIAFLFTNCHPAIFPRSTVPTIAEIGGIHIKPANPLPPDMQKFVDEAENGVILFTIGSFTSTSTIEPQLQSAFIDAFARIPQRVIWKFDDTIPNLSNNVFTSKWVPQRDILGKTFVFLRTGTKVFPFVEHYEQPLTKLWLKPKQFSYISETCLFQIDLNDRSTIAHKNVKAFITHTGTHGTFEAIHEAKPLIMVPFFGDQLSNAAILAELGVGIRLAFQNLTKEELIEAIDEVITNKIYRQRMDALSRTFRDRPMSPQETVVYWTEYVLRHNGTRHLRPRVAHHRSLYWSTIEDVTFFVLIVLTLSFILYYIVKGMYFLTIKKGNTSNKNKKKD